MHAIVHNIASLMVVFSFGLLVVNLLLDVCTDEEGLYAFLDALVMRAARRPRNFADWEIAMDDLELGEAWPVELTSPNPAARRDIPIAAETAWGAAQRFLAARRAAMGATDAHDEQLYLLEMAAFLRACGHGEVERERGTERATPVVSAYKRGPTIPVSVDVYAVTVAL